MDRKTRLAESPVERPAVAIALSFNEGAIHIP
jgi:hypothetical protein